MSSFSSSSLAWRTTVSSATCSCAFVYSALASRSACFASFLAAWRVAARLRRWAVAAACWPKVCSRPTSTSEYGPGLGGTPPRGWAWGRDCFTGDTEPLFGGVASPLHALASWITAMGVVRDATEASKHGTHTHATDDAGAVPTSTVTRSPTPAPAPAGKAVSVPVLASCEPTLASPATPGPVPTSVPTPASTPASALAPKALPVATLRAEAPSVGL